MKLPHVPFKTSTYVDVALRLVPVTFTVIFAFGEVAVNVNHCPNVVSDVASPHDPVGAALEAVKRSLVVAEQVVETVSGPGDKQEAWADSLECINVNKRATTMVLSVWFVLI